MNYINNNTCNNINSININSINNVNNVNNKNISFCNNCGKQGHLLQDCKMPITSIGIILFRINNGKYEYLMIRRKDSFGYADFIKGKIPIYNERYLLNIINEMTISEKEIIVNLFKSKQINEKIRKLFQNAPNFNENDYITEFINVIQQSTTNWVEPEWGFPKGRRNIQEKDLSCALREFEEETGYSRNEIKLFENIIPYEEVFIGSNYKAYKHKYYLAYSNEINNIQNYQKSEVSKMEWKTIDDCISCIRPYNLEKIELLTRVNTLITSIKVNK